MARVVVTGLGVTTPLGNEVAAFWKQLKLGKSAIGPFTVFDTGDLGTKIGAEVANFDPSRHFESGRLSLLDRFAQFGLVAARQAIIESGLDFRGDLGVKSAVIVGTGIGGQTTLDDNYRRVYRDGEKRVHPFTIPKLMPNAATSHITMEFGITGPAFSVSSACSSSAHAIGLAFHMVRSGMVSAAVTGGAEAALTYGTMKGWEALRVMAPDTCRPFSLGRKGMVLGEGAAIMVLENLESARARGAHIHAEIVGFGMSSDATDAVQPSSDGAASAIAACLADGELDPTAVDYVNAHGTGTVANDIAETEALHRAFGPHARRLAISSTKSMHGHALGAGGAIELAATLLAVREGIVPPTANFIEPDPRCDLDYVPNTARELPVNLAISNSFAFGGLNAVLAVKRFAG